MESVVTPPGGGRRIAYGGQEIRVLYGAGDLAFAEFDVPAGFPDPLSVQKSPAVRNAGEPE